MHFAHVASLYRLVPLLIGLTYYTSPGHVRSFELMYSASDWLNVSNVCPLGDTLEVPPCDSHPEVELGTILVRLFPVVYILPVDVSVYQHLVNLMEEKVTVPALATTPDSVGRRQLVGQVNSLVVVLVVRHLERAREFQCLCPASASDNLGLLHGVRPSTENAQGRLVFPSRQDQPSVLPHGVLPSILGSNFGFVQRFVICRHLSRVSPQRTYRCCLVVKEKVL